MMTTNTNYQLKSVEFKFGEYISQGFDLFKKDIGGFVLAYFLCFIMSIIPFCAFLAMGNFLKYCRKVKNGQPASPSEIFNFDDFVPYFILQAIALGFIIAALIPYSIIMFMLSSTGMENGSPILNTILSLITVAIGVVFYIFILKAYYVPALISLENKKDLKETWNISKIMTKNNLLMIFLFSLVVSFIGQIGVILCIIGIFVTIPLTYICHYMAYEDGLSQIKKDEIEEIGTTVSNY